MKNTQNITNAKTHIIFKFAMKNVFIFDESEWDWELLSSVSEGVKGGEYGISVKRTNAWELERSICIKKQF